MQLKLVHVVTVVILTLTAYNYFEVFDSEISRVRSGVDKRGYIVLNLPDKDVAADQLARLRIKLEKFIELLTHKKLHGNAIDRLKYRFKAVLSESKPGSKFTSYTVNKGSKIFMCIRERDENNKLIDENTLFFVALHELAHVMTISIGHKKEFWTNFKFLLGQAISEGYYKYHPYHHAPKKYCGTYISDTPLKL